MSILDGVKRELFLDIDGVLADWQHAASWLPEIVNSEEWWECMGEKFFSELDVLPGAKEFYNECKKFSEVRFLTGTVLTAGCTEGKSKWIGEFTEEGKWGRKHLIMCSSIDKRFLASPGRILVDDRQSNITAWENEGGIGVYHETGSDLTETLKKIKYEWSI